MTILLRKVQRRVPTTSARPKRREGSRIPFFAGTDWRKVARELFPAPCKGRFDLLAGERATRAEGPQQLRQRLFVVGAGWRNAGRGHRLAGCKRDGAFDGPRSR